MLRVQGKVGAGLQSLSNLLERVLDWYGEKSSTHRAAILGIGFGLLLCVMVMGICGVLAFVAQLGNGA